MKLINNIFADIIRHQTHKLTILALNDRFYMHYIHTTTGGHVNDSKQHLNGHQILTTAVVFLLISEPVIIVSAYLENENNQYRIIFAQLNTHN